VRTDDVPPDAASFTDVAALAEVPENGTLAVTLPGGVGVCLVRCGGTVSALRDECTHQAMPLSAGEVLPDGTIECAWHGARFDCRSGAVCQGPAEDDVQTFAVRVRNGRVLVGDLKIARIDPA
jgi:3-phenylpropionate/trans-cinnamate dioxygenase ferredoxin subunit